MNRLGLAIVAVLLLACAALLTMLRMGGPGGGGTASQSSTAPAPPAAGPNGLVLPVAGVRRSALRDSWADPRGGGTRTHHAIDIMAPRGTPVLAAAAGRIEKLFASRLGGTTIYERSADGRFDYYYAHLDRYAPGLAEGQAVGAGQAIGAVGSSGDADPGAPHLHFEVHVMAPGQGWWQGSEIDPYPLLAGRAAS